MKKAEAGCYLLRTQSS